MRGKFYDPWFAVATSALSIITWPVWALMVGDWKIGLYVTGGFALFVLALMLWPERHRDPQFRRN